VHPQNITWFARNRADLRRPDIRDVFILSPGTLGSDDCLHTIAAMASVNWPWSPAEVLCISSESNELQLTPAFERYVSDIDNWSLDLAVLNRFPTVADKAWIKSASDVVSESDQLGQRIAVPNASFVL